MIWFDSKGLIWKITQLNFSKQILTWNCFIKCFSLTSYPFIFWFVCLSIFYVVVISNLSSLDFQLDFSKQILASNCFNKCFQQMGGRSNKKWFMDSWLIDSDLFHFVFNPPDVSFMFYVCVFCCFCSACFSQGASVTINLSGASHETTSSTNHFQLVSFLWRLTDWKCGGADVPNESVDN